VPIDIWVRGICSLRPGVEGLSETIRVRSILGRYLEHSRIFSFENGGDPQVFIGSADMMHRNLDRRVEALVRLTRPEHITELSDLFDEGMSDATSSWWLGSDGQWTRHDRAEDGAPLADLQGDLMTRIGSRRRSSR
jgi:polyphosphate kinase